MRLNKHIITKILIGISLLWINMAAAQTITDVKIDLETRNKTLKEIFAMIEKSSDFHFVYNEDLVSLYGNMSIHAKNRTVASVLNELFLGTNLQYLYQNKKIIISKKEEYKEEVKQEIIQGRILEADSEKPVRNVSVYFDGSLNVTASDSTGNFKLYSSTTSRTPIIISAVGYFPETVADYPSGKRLIIYLRARQYELDPVEITVSDGISRREKLRVFRSEFLGSSDNGKNSRIQNEKDIALNYNKQTKTLKASCDKPIIVQNRNLGYTFNFLLQKFTSSDNETFFYGPQFFTEEQEPDKKTVKARVNAYLGSRMHFIRSLWNNKLQENGFEIYGNNILKNKVNYDDIVVTIDDKKYIRLQENVKIIYRSHISYLYKNELNKDVFIDKEGYNDPIGLDWGGVMGFQRVGDQLPLEYNP